MAAIRKRTWARRDKTQTTWVVDFLDNAGTRQRKTFRLRRDADRFRVHVEGALADGTYSTIAATLTVRDLCTRFIENCDGRQQRGEKMERKTVLTYRGFVSNHVLHADHGLGRVKLSALTRPRIGKFRDDLRSAGVSVATTRKIIAMVHTMLEYAIDQGFTKTNPARHVRVITPRGQGAKPISVPSRADVSALLEVADATTRLRILFAALTGLRAGEQWALTWADMDFQKREISVTRRVDVYHKLAAPKSEAGVRTVPLPDRLVKELKAWRLQSKFSKPDDLIFHNKNGGFVWHDNFVARFFTPLFEKTSRNPSPPARFNWHALRHHAISTWIAAGIPLMTVQTYAGHASLRLTADRYGHLLPDEDHHEKLDAIAKELA